MKITGWDKKIGYQIFPLSFKSANGGSYGDIKGITGELEYLQRLGIDLLWLCPVYKSSFIDAGYDVDDYYTISERLGTNADVDELIAEAKKRGITIVFDIVLNHTSNHHTWFLDILKNGKKSKYFNYYIWSEKAGENWSIFTGSAWEFCPEVGMYYYHLFSKQQPDLNWENPEVRAEVAKILNYWIKQGIGGFRVDALEHVGKDVDINKFSFGSKMEPYLVELYEATLGKVEGIYSVGESWGVKAEQVERYTEGSHKLVDSFFNFGWANIGARPGTYGKGQYTDYKASDFKHGVQYWQENISGAGKMANFLSNHDMARAISRWGSKTYWAESAKLLATMQFMLRGVPYIYYGEEIGMLNPSLTKLSDFRDVEVMNSYRKFVLEDKTVSESEFLNRMTRTSRDNSRAPMQWDSSPNAGFCPPAVTPWIKISDSYKSINVKAQINDHDSIFSYYRKLIQLRKASVHSDVITYGTTSYLESDNENVLLIERRHNNKCLLVFLNFSDDIQKVVKLRTSRTIFNNCGSFKSGTLQPWQAVVLEITNTNEEVPFIKMKTKQDKIATPVLMPANRPVKK